MSEAATRRLTRAWAGAAVLAAWALGYGQLLASGLALVPGDPGDSRLVHLFLEHGWLALGGASFWDVPMFFPERAVMAWSEVVLGAAPLYWLPRALGAGPALAYALWLLLVAALDALAMQRVLLRLVGTSGPASVVGAALFAAGAPVLNQAAHPQLLPRFLVVFAALAVACLGEQWLRPVAVHLPSMQQHSERVAARVPRGCRAFLLRWEGGVQPSYEAHVEAAWAALLSGVPTVNGLSGRVPEGWDFETTAGPGATHAEVLLAVERWMRRHGDTAEGVCVLPGG